jgi:rhomboid family GlyGly-CTERM serine protease
MLLLRSWGWPIALAVICVAFEGLGDDGRTLLRLDRQGLGQWQLWRLATAHLAHLGISHMSLNLFAFIVLKSLFEGLMRPLEWFWVALLSIVAIDAGLLTLSSDVQWYVGLSGLLHGVAVAGALAFAIQARVLGRWLLAAILIKIAVEQLVGPLPYSVASSGGPVVVDAHLYGAIGGAIGWTIGVFLPPRSARSV